MNNVSTTDQAIINEFKSALDWLKVTDRELSLMAHAMNAGLKLAGGVSPMLELAALTGKVREMAQGGDLKAHR